MDIELIAGLGNPDKDYENTYHNLGFRMLDYLAGMHKTEWREGKGGKFRFADIGDFKLIKPSVFMNDSGGAVLAALKQFPSSPTKMLVVHDDADIHLGKFKIVMGGRSAGHKGVESVINSLGTNDFWRLKIGIRPLSESVRKKAEKLVLAKITKTDWIKFQKVFEEAAAKITGPSI